MSLAGSADEALSDARLAAEAGFDLIAIRRSSATSPRQLGSRSRWLVDACGLGRRNGTSTALDAGVEPHLPTARRSRQAGDHGGSALGRSARCRSGSRRVPDSDHTMAGVPEWSPRTGRPARRVRAGSRRSASRRRLVRGRLLPLPRRLSWAPGPLQQPRPPILIGAVGPRMLRDLRRLADVWSASADSPSTMRPRFSSRSSRRLGRSTTRANRSERDPRCSAARCWRFGR